MKRQLNNDITRCYGRECFQREQCQRYLTIAIDKEGVYSYCTNLNTSDYGNGPCDSFKEDM